MKKTLLSMLMLSFVMVFISCNQAEHPVMANNNSDNGIDSEFYIQSLDEIVAFDEATIDDEPEYCKDMTDGHGDGDMDGMGHMGDMGKGHRNCDKKDGDGDDNRMHPRGRDGMSLGKVIRAMDLTDRQMAALRGLMGDFRDCMRRVMAATSEARYEIIQRARAERLKIIRAFRAGEITRERAIAQLRQLNQKMREALRNEIDWTLRCKCIRNLFADIQDILTERQLVIWQRFIDSLHGPCFERDGNDD